MSFFVLNQILEWYFSRLMEIKDENSYSILQLYIEKIYEKKRNVF